MKSHYLAFILVCALVQTAYAQNGDPPSSVTPGTGTWIWANQNGDFSGSYSISSGTEVDVFAFRSENGICTEWRSAFKCNTRDRHLDLGQPEWRFQRQLQHFQRDGGGCVCV